MAQIKILIEGYARPIQNGWKASSTVALIRAHGKNIIVDPGCDRKKLLGVFRKEKVKIPDIDFVFLTHGHVDHSGLAGIFVNAKIIDELYVYDSNSIVKHGGIIPGTDIQVIRTPGHTSDHASLIVPIRKVIYAIAGDVFWWTEDEKQTICLEKPDNDPEHMNLSRLIASRKKLLKIADYIIPGHGKVFRVHK